MSTQHSITTSLHGAEAAAMLRPLRVLLVEDSEDDALLLGRHLNKAGFTAHIHRVETAEKMVAALEQRWDCVLADYNLPLFSAPEALALLKSTEHDIPFIMMSGAVSEATAVAAMRAGAHDYVSKENLTRLAPAIERELAEAASRRVKRATERALRSSEERFHRLVEATPLALLISDLRGRVTYYNQGVERLLGFSQAHLEDEPVLLQSILPDEDLGRWTPGADPSEHIASVLRAKASERPGETWQMTCAHRDGTGLPVLLGVATLNPEAATKELQLAIFLVDLSAQKQSEEVLRRTEKLAAAGRLAASIAHEINNPLEAITNCLYLLEQGNLDEQQRTFLSMAQQELNRVTHITTQTLRFYRQSTRPMLTDIADVINSVLTLYEARIRDHGIQIIREFDGVPPIMALDGELRQVLANLIGNAVDAMSGREGTRTLTLRARASTIWPTGEPGLSLIVADRGSGMSKDTLRRIYEPFFSTKGITGTGLGLWVSIGIVEKHHGRIQVRTRQQETSGTVFRLHFPLRTPPETTLPEANIPTLA